MRYALYILMRRFHSLASCDSSRAAFSLLSSLSTPAGAGVCGVGAPHAGGRKLTKRLEKRESEAMWA